MATKNRKKKSIDSRPIVNVQLALLSRKIRSRAAGRNALKQMANIDNMLHESEYWRGQEDAYKDVADLLDREARKE